jgi:hypothetical protein
MPSMTYEPIETKTLSTAAVSVTFSSVPSTYTDLILIWNGVTATSNNVSLQFNSDTATNYSTTRIRGTGTSAESSRWTNINMMYGPNPDTTGNSTVTWQIQNYSNSTTNKTAIARGGGAGGETGAYVGLWRNTNAINSVTVIINGSVNMNIGTTITLYGIKAA